MSTLLLLFASLPTLFGVFIAYCCYKLVNFPFDFLILVALSSVPVFMVAHNIDLVYVSNGVGDFVPDHMSVTGTVEIYLIVFLPSAILLIALRAIKRFRRK